MRDVLWWFERGGVYLTVEVLIVGDGQYELRLRSPDGEERVENFRSASDLAARQEVVRAGLVASGWNRSHEWVL